MSAAASSTDSIELQPRQPKLALPLSGQIPSTYDSNDAGFFFAPSPRPGVTRHYDSLEEHAKALRGGPITPGGRSTPRLVDRREGFVWEIPKSEDIRQNPFHFPPTPVTPPPLDEFLPSPSTDSLNGDNGPHTTKIDNGSSRPSPKLPSASASPTGTMSRSDTDQSSSSGIVRGAKNHVPDMRMFLPEEKKPRGDEESSSHGGRRKSKVGRYTKSDSHATRNDTQSQRRTPNATATASEKPSLPPKSTLKDRRKLAQSEAMKLTLPLELPDLPSRNRMALSELNSIVPPRPRSPKTPWIHDRTPEWHTSGPATAPATIFEDDNYAGSVLLPGNDTIISSQTPQTEKPLGGARHQHSVSRMRFRRATSSTRTSESSPRHSPTTLPINSPSATSTQAQQSHPPEALQELGKRSRRWRWSGPRSSSDLAATPSPASPASPDKPLFSISHILKSKRSGQSGVTNRDSTNMFGWRRKQSIPVRPDDSLATVVNMPVPPAFIPPGLQRVPTPPMLDANGEVKGKLADFFFELQGERRRPKAPHTSGGVWDSDVLLMSQQSNISSPSDPSDESPQGANDTSPASNAPNSPNKATSPSSIPILISPPRPLSRIATDATTNHANEKAKLEWVIPEHLPNSPLCPLHVKYRGPSKGACVYHGRRGSSGVTYAQEEEGGKRGWASKRASGIFDGVQEVRRTGSRKWRLSWMSSS